jgi:REP element-mobilizing transposase RayT
MTFWLLTSTFYGQWLPGDKRGSVTNVRDLRAGDRRENVRREHSQSGEMYEGHLPGLHQAALSQLKGPPVAVNLVQAEALLEQFIETAAYRGWELHAVSIMANHVHLVVEVQTPPADAGGSFAGGSFTGKSQLLRDFKGYGSRRLNRLFGVREAKTWWSDGGSGRVVRNVASAIHYVCHRQPRPLVVWSQERGRIPVEESHVGNVFGGGASPH